MAIVSIIFLAWILLYYVLSIFKRVFIRNT